MRRSIFAWLMGEFMDSGAGVFDRDLVERALDDTIAPLVVPK